MGIRTQPIETRQDLNPTSTGPRIPGSLDGQDLLKPDRDLDPRYYDPRGNSVILTSQKPSNVIRAPSPSPRSPTANERKVMAAASSTEAPHNFFRKCPLLFPAFPNLPFSTSPPSSPRPNLLSSAADRLLRTLSDAAQNPFFQRLLSPFSDAPLHAISQIRFKHCGSPNPFSAHNFAAILPGDTVAGVVVTNGILNFLNIYNTLLVVRLVLTWFPNSPPAIVSPLSTICDPYLNIFRGIIPPLGGTLDLSPILAFLVLNAFTSAAAALPAELPVSGTPQHRSSTQPKLFNPTAMQKKWMRRLSGKGLKTTDERS
ncbi:ylmG homolog protein 2, chloroplastic [Magnolia sinica]|uniref:ylmG homolog protein 2, chloroplastic n=1 Tax=Magnolia sinica TaxID=86752 RepID=UPI00265A18A0|nr:ylmG homolog protein 2, chloroplastic [Magnolia sinica]